MFIYAVVNNYHSSIVLTDQQCLGQYCGKFNGTDCGVSTLCIKVQSNEDGS